MGLKSRVCVFVNIPRTVKESSEFWEENKRQNKRQLSNFKPANENSHLLVLKDRKIGVLCVRLVGNVCNST